MRSFVKLSLLAGLLPLVACSKASTEDEDYCLDPNYLVPLEVTVDVDGSFRDYLTIDSIFQKTRSPDASPVLKYYAAAYPVTSGLPSVIASSYERKVPLKVHPGRYSMVGWVMYESGESGLGTNFYDDDFGELLLRNKYNYSGADPTKLAYRGAELKNIAYNTPSISLTATPVMGKYRLVATDTAAFIPDKVIVYYSSNIPSAIHAKTGKFNWWWSDIGFESDASGKQHGGTLASDYILSQNDEQTTVTAIIEVYDDSGVLRARKKNLVIPLVNGGVTTIKGNFFSILEVDNDATAGSGISIKTEWDATFEIEI